MTNEGKDDCRPISRLIIEVVEIPMNNPFKYYFDLTRDADGVSHFDGNSMSMPMVAALLLAHARCMREDGARSRRADFYHLRRLSSENRIMSLPLELTPSAPLINIFSLSVFAVHVSIVLPAKVHDVHLSLSLFPSIRPCESCSS